MNVRLPLILLLLISHALSAQTIYHSEMLGRATDQSITVQLFFSDSAEMSVQYGTNAGVYPYQTPWQLFADSVPAEIVINGLLPDTRYFYRVCYRHPGDTAFTTRPEYTFHTQRAAASSFIFDVEADPHLDAMSDSALYRRCLQNQLADAPDFMIDLGDFLMSDKLKNTSGQLPFDTIPYRCNLFHSFYETASHSVPLYIAIGNHEGESGWNLNGTANNVAVWGAQQRKKYFMNPAPDAFYAGDTTNQAYIGQRENYYAWRWGSALFIVLDPYWYTNPKPDSLHGWRWTLGKPQYDWLKATLDSTTATFKFVFAHQIIGGDPNGRGGVEYANLYEWGGNNIDSTPGFAANRPGWYKPIKDLLAEHHVNIFFHGHDHFFAKQDKDCLIYQETPQPDLPNFVNPPLQAADYGYFQGQILPNTGHLRVTVDAAGVQVEYIRAYLPSQETATRHNQDVSATYYIGAVNCYDSITGIFPVLWNSNYSDELIYPNPFATQTKIEFTVEKTEHITFQILNQNGQSVRTLIAGNMVQEGKYDIIWDGNDGYGVPLPTGVYIYTIAGEYDGVKKGKIMLVR